jgi:hypothetical protein
MSETNANNIIISILDKGKGSYSLSLDRLLRLFYKPTRPFEYRPLFQSVLFWYRLLELLLEIPQSVQTQNVVINRIPVMAPILVPILGSFF